MNALACPHCKAILPHAPPGVVRCSGCQGYATVPGPADVARLEKKRRDEKMILMAIAAVVFVVYVGPVLLMLGYMCFIAVVYVAMIVVAVAAA